MTGIALTAVGFIGAVVFQLQPWRSCPYDDSPAACAMLPDDYRAFLAFVLVPVLGVIVLAVPLVLELVTARQGRLPAE